MNSITSSFVLFLSLIASWPALAQSDCPLASVVLPLHTSVEVLENMLNRDIPDQMSGREDISIPVVTEERLLWSMRRSQINLTADNDRLRASTNISGRVRVRGRVLVSFSVSLNLGIAVNFSMRPVLGNDWRLRPNAEANARVSRAYVRIRPVGNISVRTQSQRAVDRFLRRMERRINEKFERNESLQREGQELWQKLHRVEKLSEEPPMWLVIRPNQIGATNLSINADGIDFGISVVAETNISFGDEPPSLVPEELPQLQILDELPKGKIELALPIFSNWETLNGIVAENLAKNPVISEGSSGRLTLSSIRLAAAPEESVLVSAALSVEPTGWTGRVLHRIQNGLQAVGLPFSLIEVLDNQLVEMSVKPIVSENGRVVVLKNAKLMPRSSDLVKTVADTYTWLTDETIEELIERHAVADLSAPLDEVEKDAQEKVNELTKELGKDGFSLSVEIQPVTRFSSVSILPEGLVAKVCAAADTKAEIRSFDF